jgi:hypothetical protein
LRGNDGELVRWYTRHASLVGEAHEVRTHDGLSDSRGTSVCHGVACLKEHHVLPRGFGLRNFEARSIRRTESATSRRLVASIPFYAVLSLTCGILLATCEEHISFVACFHRRRTIVILSFVDIVSVGYEMQPVGDRKSVTSIYHLPQNQAFQNNILA